MAQWTFPATSDMKGAWDHIAETNEPAADRTIATLSEAANRLDRFPRMGRPGPFSGTRQFFVPGTAYKLIYRMLANGEAEILRVYHTSRDWPPKH